MYLGSNKHISILKIILGINIIFFYLFNNLFLCKINAMEYKCIGSLQEYYDGNIPPNVIHITGNNNEYILYIVYDGNTIIEDFKGSGLYTNDDKKNLIYSLPNICDTYKIYVSNDGLNVCLLMNNYLLYNDYDVPKALPVFLKYYNGKLISELKLSDINKNNNNLQPILPNGCLWYKEITIDTDVKEIITCSDDIIKIDMITNDIAINGKTKISKNNMTIFIGICLFCIGIISLIIKLKNKIYIRC